MTSPSMTRPNEMTGGCLCGEVRFTAAPSQRHTDVCHCGMCRRWAAGPAFMVDCGESVEFTKGDGLSFYRSSEWAERGFCNRCGSPLCYRLVGKTAMFVSMEALDDRDGFTFTKQIFIDEKPGYYTFENRTQNMTGAEVFAAFSQAGN